MKKLVLITGFVGLLIGTINSQDTISHIISGCVYNEKSTFDEEPCPPGVFFNYEDDTLYISGTIGANCCGTHLAIVQIERDTIFIATQDTGELCNCGCGFCFEVKIPATNEDTIVSMNGIIYNTKVLISSMNQNEYEDFKVIPNPFDSELRIIADHKLLQTIFIIDFTGRTFQKIDCSHQNEFMIDTNSWPPGIYLVHLRMSNYKWITRKTVKVE